MNEANRPGDLPAVQSTVSGVLGAGLGFILIAGPVIAFLWFGKSIGGVTDSISYGALEVLLVLSSTLAGLIVVTQALGLAQPGAALGLPKGSVRALLAFSLVIIFVAVASWNLGGFLRGQPATAQYMTVPKDAEPAALEALKGQNAFVANRTDTTTQIAYFGADPEAQRRATDMAKDVMTVVATVLVTIVGFYFGSSSTIDGANSAQTTMKNVKNALFDTEKPVPFVPEDIARAKDGTRALADELKSRLDNVVGDPKTSQLDAAVSKEPSLKPRVDEAKTVLAALKEQARAANVYATDAETIAKGITASSDKDAVNDAGRRITDLQANAKKAKDTFDAQLKKFSEAQAGILAQVASG